MELPVEIQLKSSTAGWGPEAPIQPIGLAMVAVCLQRVYWDARMLPYQKGACVSVWRVGGRFLAEGIKASRHKGKIEVRRWEFLF